MLLDKNMPKKSFWYVKIKKINITIHIIEKNYMFAFVERLELSGSFCQIHYFLILITIITRKHKTQSNLNCCLKQWNTTGYEVRIKASKKSKKHLFPKNLTIFMTFLGGKVIIMTKNKTMTNMDALGPNQIPNFC